MGNNCCTTNDVAVKKEVVNDGVKEFTNPSNIVDRHAPDLNLYEQKELNEEMVLLKESLIQNRNFKIEEIKLSEYEQGLPELGPYYDPEQDNTYWGQYLYKNKLFI